MKKTYTKKQIEKAIAYWQKQINESASYSLSTDVAKDFIKIVVEKVNIYTTKELMNNCSLHCFNTNNSHRGPDFKTPPAIMLNTQKSITDTLVFDIAESRDGYSLYEFLMDFSTVFKHIKRRLSTFKKVSIFYNGNECAINDVFEDKFGRIMFEVGVSPEKSEFADMLEGEQLTREQMLEMI